MNKSTIVALVVGVLLVLFLIFAVSKFTILFLLLLSVTINIVQYKIRDKKENEPKSVSDEPSDSP